jgi:hypothetical protein
MVQILSIGYTPGLYNLECVLADASGTELTNPEARAKRAVQLQYDPLDLATTKCAKDADCDDGNNCSAEICIAGTCKYTALANCCTDDWFCAPGESCLNPNTLTSKCSACTLDSDCDDGVACNVDKCDMTGNKGVCTHVLPPNSCCAGNTKCDDGKPCTIDSCDLATSTCTHDQPAGACCARLLIPAKSAVASASSAATPSTARSRTAARSRPTPLATTKTSARSTPAARAWAVGPSASTISIPRT